MVDFERSWKFMSTKKSGKRSRNNAVVRSRPSRIKDANQSGLGTAGKQLFEWVEKYFEIDSVRPVVNEMCELADRLADVRVELKKSPDARLINAEVKLSAAFARCWKLAGFGDNDVPKNRVGRPAGIPTMPRVVA
jgi:hypothetical protein